MSMESASAISTPPISPSETMSSRPRVPVRHSSTTKAESTALSVSAPPAWASMRRSEVKHWSAASSGHVYYCMVSLYRTMTSSTESREQQCGGARQPGRHSLSGPRLPRTRSSTKYWRARNARASSPISVCISAVPSIKLGLLQ